MALLFPGPTVRAALLLMDLAALGQICYCRGPVPSSGRRKEVRLWQKAVFGDIHCIHDISHMNVSHPLEFGGCCLHSGRLHVQLKVGSILFCKKKEPDWRGNDCWLSSHGSYVTSLTPNFPIQELVNLLVKCLAFPKDSVIITILPWLW